MSESEAFSMTEAANCARVLYQFVFPIDEESNLLATENIDKAPSSPFTNLTDAFENCLQEQNHIGNKGYRPI